MRGNIILHAPAKINLFLKVGGKRPDGYHSICTLFHKITLFDVIKIAKSDRIKVSCPQGTVPSGKENIAYLAAERFFEHTSISPGADIEIEKHIPVAAGLGGGSSNAAAVLVGLQSLHGNPCTDEEIFLIAKGLGADIPFFLLAYSLALGRGTGCQLEPVPSPAYWWFVLVNPGIQVSTRWVYENLKLTSRENPFMFSPVDVSNIETFLQNDLESVTASKYPIINLLKEKLVSYGAHGALMSGSGPTVFGLFREQGKARLAYSKLREEADSTWAVYLAKSHDGWGVVKR